MIDSRSFRRKLATNSYAYDHLDRLLWAAVSTPLGQMVEERRYTYDTLGNLMSFRLAYPAEGHSNGAFGAGTGDLGSTNYQGLSGFSAFGDSPYVTGFTPNLPAPPSTTRTRAQFGNGAGAGTSTNYQSRGAFFHLTGAGDGTNYDVDGLPTYVRGMQNGMGVDPGSLYYGPYGSENITYSYDETNGAGPHAVTSRSNGDTFSYDANGNMTARYDAADNANWTYTFDAENRLVSASDGTTTTTYVYDAGGKRVVRSVDDSTTVTDTVYVAGMEIELVDGTESQRTINYPVGGVIRIIGGSDEGLYFRHTDHLGSTSVLSDENGNKVAGSDVVYAPFGESRTGTPSELTDQGFTGQRLDRSADGLMYYNARYYLPELRRFISADTIVPDPGNPQDMNRYAYSRNNPGKYTDPTGHEPEMWSDEWWVARYYALELWKYEDPGVNETTNAIANAIIGGNALTLKEQLGQFGIELTAKPGTSYEANAGAILNAVSRIATRIKEAIVGLDNYTDGQAFMAVFGPTTSITAYKSDLQGKCGAEFTGNACNIGSLYKGADIHILASALLSQGEDKDFGENLLIHEFGHTFTGPTYTQTTTNAATGEETNELIATFNYFPGIFNFKQYPGSPEIYTDYPFSVALAEKQDTDPEITADAFMHWILESDGLSTSQMSTLSQFWGNALNAAALINQESRMP